MGPDRGLSGGGSSDRRLRQQPEGDHSSATIGQILRLRARWFILPLLCVNDAGRGGGARAASAAYPPAPAFAMLWLFFLIPLAVGFALYFLTPEAEIG